MFVQASVMAANLSLLLYTNYTMVPGVSVQSAMYPAIAVPECQ